MPEPRLHCNSPIPNRQCRGRTDRIASAISVASLTVSVAYLPVVGRPSRSSWHPRQCGKITPLQQHLRAVSSHADRAHPWLDQDGADTDQSRPKVGIRDACPHHGQGCRLRIEPHPKAAVEMIIISFEGGAHGLFERFRHNQLRLSLHLSSELIWQRPSIIGYLIRAK